MSSSSEAVIAYERARLERAGYRVITTPIAELPKDAELGNDVIVGTLKVGGIRDGVNLEAPALQTEGGVTNGAALQRGVLVVLRRRYLLDRNKFSDAQLSDAVRLRPYRVPREEKNSGKQ